MLVGGWSSFSIVAWQFHYQIMRTTKKKVVGRPLANKKPVVPPKNRKTCSMNKCQNTSATSNLYRFPRDPNLREQWAAKTGRSKEWIRKVTNKIGANKYELDDPRTCAGHFTKADFSDDGIKRKNSRLVASAVPRGGAAFVELSTKPERVVPRSVRREHNAQKQDQDRQEKKLVKGYTKKSEHLRRSNAARRYDEET